MTAIAVDEDAPVSVRAQGAIATRLADRTAQPPHAMLLTGPPGCGIEQIARWAASKMLGSDDQARDQRLALEGIHPDIIDLVATGATFSVNDDIRDIALAEARRAPTESNRKVIVVHEAERLDDAPANALLRTLEEPPPWLTFLLTTTRSDAVLATIRSRCEAFALNAISSESVVEVLVSEGIPSHAAEQAVKEVGPDIDRARALAGPYRLLVDSATDAIDRLDGSAHTAVMVSAELIALLDNISEALEATQAQERSQLEETSNQRSPRAMGALQKRMDLRHARQRRKVRTQALVEAILAVERVARDRMVSGQHLVRQERIFHAAAAARNAVHHNTGEGLVIESFFVAVL